MQTSKIDSASHSSSHSTSANNTSTQATNNNAKPTFVDAETLRLREMYERLNQRMSPTSGNGHFLKFTKDGEHKRLFFDHSKTVEEDIEYPSEPGKKIHRVKFYVYQVENGRKSGILEEWTASVRTSKDIIKWLVKGYYEIDITRHGMNKNDTRYDVDPVL